MERFITGFAAGWTIGLALLLVVVLGCLAFRGVTKWRVRQAMRRAWLAEVEAARERLRVKLQAEVARRLGLGQDGKKIPYTDEGLAFVERGVREVLQEGVTEGLLAAPGYVEIHVEPPQSEAEKAGRVLRVKGALASTPSSEWFMQPNVGKPWLEHEAEMAKLRDANGDVTFTMADGAQLIPTAFVPDAVVEDPKDAEIRCLRTALEKIVDHDGSGLGVDEAKTRYTDEWTQAEAFTECQRLAAEALGRPVAPYLPRPPPPPWAPDICEVRERQEEERKAANLYRTSEVHVPSPKGSK